MDNSDFMIEAGERDEYMLAAFSKYRMLGRRELEVVKSLAMARSGREIAEQLSVSERAVAP